MHGRQAGRQDLTAWQARCIWQAGWQDLRDAWQAGRRDAGWQAGRQADAWQAQTQNARAMAGVRIKQNARAMAGVSVSDDQRQNCHNTKRDGVYMFFGHVMRPPARASRAHMIWRGANAPDLI
jgi:hypothetical protein